MKLRLFPLALCICLGLSACTLSTDGPQPTPEVDPGVEETVTPSAEPTESITAPDPSDAGEMTADLPEDETPDTPPSGEVGSQPIETSPTPSEQSSAQPSDELCTLPVAPTPEATPSATPAPTPEATPEPAQDFTAADIYAMWLTTSSQFPAPGSDFMDMSPYLDAYYNLDKGDLESFVFYQPSMSGTLQEVFVARAKPGKAGTVKSACQGRLAGLQEEAAFYTGTGNYVDSAILETVGDWVVLAACPQNDRLVKILKDTVK